MRTIIAGSRSINDYAQLGNAIIQSRFKISRVLSGCAVGVDLCGEHWADIHEVPVERYPANWSELGASAGIIRNVHMAQSADALIALWDGQSKGTRHMIKIALEKGLKLYVQTILPAS